MADKPATKKKTSLLKKIFNLPLTINAKKEELAAILKNKVVRNLSTNMPNITLPILCLIVIESDKVQELSTREATWIKLISKQVKMADKPAPIK